jgi:hypothetical protein
VTVHQYTRQIIVRGPRRNPSQQYCRASLASASLWGYSARTKPSFHVYKAFSPLPLSFQREREREDPCFLPPLRRFVKLYCPSRYNTALLFLAVCAHVVLGLLMCSLVFERSLFCSSIGGTSICLIHVPALTLFLFSNPNMLSLLSCRSTVDPFLYSFNWCSYAVLVCIGSPTSRCFSPRVCFCSTC